MIHEFFPGFCNSPRQVNVQLDEKDYAGRPALENGLYVQGKCPIINKMVTYGIEFQNGEPVKALCLNYECAYNTAKTN